MKSNSSATCSGSSASVSGNAQLVGLTVAGQSILVSNPNLSISLPGGISVIIGDPLHSSGLEGQARSPRTESDHLAREQAVTENISPHGARVISKRYWLPGEEVILARAGEFPKVGRVIYCEKTNHFCVGIEFPDRSLKWDDYLRT